MKGTWIMYVFLLIIAVIILRNAAGFVAAFLGFSTGASGIIGTLQGPAPSSKSVSFTGPGGKAVSLR